MQIAGDQETVDAARQAPSDSEYNGQTQGSCHLRVVTVAII
jgi:hypothetical protein